MAPEVETNDNAPENVSDAEPSPTMSSTRDNPGEEEAVSRVPAGISLSLLGGGLRRPTARRPSPTAPRGTPPSTPSSSPASGMPPSSPLIPPSRGRGRLVHRCNHHWFPELLPRPAPAFPSAPSTSGPEASRTPSTSSPPESVPGAARRHRHHHCVRPSPHVQAYLEAAALRNEVRNGVLQARVEQNQQETGVVDQSFDLLNRLGTNVSVLSTQPSTVESAANEFAESLELEENTLDENVSAEDGESVQSDNLTEAPANMPPTSPGNGPPGRGSRSIAESLQELKEEQETQIKERLDLSKKEEENQSALRRLREDLAKYEKEQKDLERKRKAMMEVSGITLSKDITRVAMRAGA